MNALCTPNIGPFQRRRRLIVGVAMFAFTLALAAVLIALGLPRVWRVLTIVPAWVGALGVFQVREQTCVALAARGLRNMDSGDEAIVDPIELHHVREQARRVHIQAGLFALAAAAFFTLLLPI